LLLSVALALASTVSAGGDSTQPPASIDGNRFVAQVLRDLGQHVSISAKLRQESRLHDQKLVGSGVYLQKQLAFDKRLTRWEMRTQIGDQTASFLQVHVVDEGDYLWTDRRLPSGRTVHRLDTEWLQTKLKQARKGTPSDEFEPLIATVEGQGGLGQMLGDLLRNFDFQPPQPIQLNGAAKHALIGQWKPERLLALWPDAARLGEAEPPEWPEQIPHHVLVLVRRNMFPSVIEYRRAADAPLASSLAGLRPTGDPLLREEIFETQFAVAIPDEQFEFVPGEIQWTDETALVLEQLTTQRTAQRNEKMPDPAQPLPSE